MSRQSVAKTWIRLGNPLMAGNALTGHTLPTKITRHTMRNITLLDVIGKVKVDLLDKLEGDKNELELSSNT